MQPLRSWKKSTRLKEGRRNPSMDAPRYGAMPSSIHFLNRAT